MGEEAKRGGEKGMQKDYKYFLEKELSDKKNISNIWRQKASVGGAVLTMN